VEDLREIGVSTPFKSLGILSTPTIAFTLVRVGVAATLSIAPGWADQNGMSMRRMPTMSAQRSMQGHAPSLNDALKRPKFNDIRPATSGLRRVLPKDFEPEKNQSQDQKDSKPELPESEMLPLQAPMDNKSQLMPTLSKPDKKTSGANPQIIRNNQ
jgi:hypothetical protein